MPRIIRMGEDDNRPQDAIKQIESSLCEAIKGLVALDEEGEIPDYDAELIQLLSQSFQTGWMLRINHKEEHDEG